MIFVSSLNSISIKCKLIKICYFDVFESFGVYLEMKKQQMITQEKAKWKKHTRKI